MIWRTFDPEAVTEATDPYPELINDNDMTSWIRDKDQLAFRNSEGDMALFDWRRKGVYMGHYFFKSRGAAALKAGKDFIDEVFKPEYDVSIILGFTPHSKRGAMWLSRQLGFVNHGDTDIGDEPHRIFILTRQDYNGFNNQ